MKNTPSTLKRRKQKEAMRQEHLQRHELSDSRVCLVTHSENQAQREHASEIRPFRAFFMDDEKRFHEVPPLVENGEQVEVQVLEEEEIFDPDEFLVGFRQQGEQEPPPALNPLRNPSPPRPLHRTQGTPRSYTFSPCTTRRLHS